MKSAPAATSFLGNTVDRVRWTWATSLVLYAVFAAIVFLVQGSEPLLGPDHVNYFRLADSIIDTFPAGDYWRSTNSVRSFGVLLAYLHAWTASHILSMKLMLAAASVLYLLSAELLFGLFTKQRWQAILLALLSGFAVSFGISSWGVTDSIALLPRTLVAPIIMLSIWFWLRFYDQPVKYLVFSFLIIGSLLHLSTFYVIGLLGLLELWDFVAIRKFRIDARAPAFLGGLALAAMLLYLFESVNLSVHVIQSLIPKLFSVPIFAVVDVPFWADAQTRTASASEAWALELSLRPWRNMPLRLANVANLFSSCALVLLLALYGLARVRKAGFTSTDRFMVAMFVAIPVFAFLPQTILWILRSFMDVYPATIEEIRAIGLIMIPVLYFVLRLLQQIHMSSGPHRNLKTAAVIVAVVVLPLTIKSLTPNAREGILSAMSTLHMVDPASAASVANARSALGIAHSTPFYYSTQDVIRWIRGNTPLNSRILTERDELLLVRDREIVGPKQVAAVPPRAGVELPGLTRIYFQTMQAMQSRDLSQVQLLAMSFGADFVIVPWRVDGAPFQNDYFSVVPVQRPL
jgi:hypothetical protein